MKLKTRQITVTAILLAICIVSQFFKNLNVYITGPIINAALILTTVYAGLACGIILSVITPITSFFITGSPIMAAIPAMFPCIMIGNIILVLAVALLRSKFGISHRIDWEGRCIILMHFIRRDPINSIHISQYGCMNQSDQHSDNERTTYFPPRHPMPSSY